MQLEFRKIIEKKPVAKRTCWNGFGNTYRDRDLMDLRPTPADRDIEQNFMRIYNNQRHSRVTPWDGYIPIGFDLVEAPHHKMAFDVSSVESEEQVEHTKQVL